MSFSFAQPAFNSAQQGSSVPMMAYSQPTTAQPITTTTMTAPNVTYANSQPMMTAQPMTTTTTSAPTMAYATSQPMTMSQPMTTSVPQYTSTTTMAQPQPMTTTMAQPTMTMAQPTMTMAQPTTTTTMAQPMTTTMAQPMTTTMAQPMTTTMAQPMTTTMAQPMTTTMAQPMMSTAQPSAPSTVTYSAPTMMASGFSPSSAAQEATMWGGGCPWQSDKTAFKEWVKKAVDQPLGKERRELYAFLSECFLDADGDLDGMVSHEEFDFLLEKAASIPRRFGMAPTWQEHYGTVAQRQAGRNQMFSQMDKHRRGKIGMEDWTQFCLQHIAGKVRAMNQQRLDFAHLESQDAETFVSFLEKALANRHSEEYKTLYEHLFKTFVESDVGEKGAIHRHEFDGLIEDAAKAPRVLGLAPQSTAAYPNEQAKRAARDQEFQAMDLDRDGAITFHDFLAWAVNHIQGKVTAYRSGVRFNQPSGGACPMGAQFMGAGSPMMRYS